MTYANTDDFLRSRQDDLKVLVTHHPSSAPAVMLVINIGCHEHMTEYGEWLAQQLTQLLGVDVQCWDDITATQILGDERHNT